MAVTCINFYRASQRPEWVREAFTKAVDEAPSGYVVDREFFQYRPFDDPEISEPFYAVEFVKRGSRGKESFVLLFRREAMKGGEKE